VGAAEELLREAAGLFRDLGRPRSQAETLVDLAKLRLQRRDLAAGHEYLAEAQAVFRAPRANEVSATALLLEAQMRLYARDADQRRFQGALGKALRAAEEAGNKDLELQAYSLGGLAGLRFGDLDESYAQLSRAAETLEERASSLRSPARRGRFLQGHDPRLVARALARLTRRLARAGAGVAPLPETAALRLSLHEAGRHLEMTRRRFDKQNAGLKRILAIGNALNSTRDPARLFDLILDSILDLTRAERGFLLLTRPEGDFEVKAARTRGEDVSGDPRSEIAFGPVARVIRERKPLLLKDAAAAAGEGTRSVFRLDLRSILCVPLFHRERVLGALYVDNRTQAGQFDADDLELLTIFGSQAAVALENARLVTDLENSLRDLKDTQDLLIRNEKLRVVGEMASGVFHDLNNLLTAVVGRTQLLMTDAGLRRHADELQVIEKAALDGAEIIQGFQNFTRPGQEVRFEPVRLSEVVEDALNLSRTKWRDQPQREGREVHVVRRVADPLYVLGNPRELREVLVNLIFNAVDALPRGGTITLEAEGAGEVALVRVRDDGVGMTQEVRRRLFDPFFTTKGPKGTGLGMSICYSILQRHKGSISVESTPGQGTVISLTLLRATGATAPAHAGSDTGGVLVIDDEESILNLLQSAFTAAGLRVCTSKSGKEGLARFKNGNFGFVITDFKMPGLSGLDVAREVKRLAPSVPVALVTAWPVEGSDAGDPPRYVDRVVHKPFRVHELIEMVGESLSARAG
jgi:signal transduction histidine kinase/CheY-like chemotaxis protein